MGSLPFTVLAPTYIIVFVIIILILVDESEICKELEIERYG